MFDGVREHLSWFFKIMVTSCQNYADLSNVTNAPRIKINDSTTEQRFEDSMSVHDRTHYLFTTGKNSMKLFEGV